MIRLIKKDLLSDVSQQVVLSQEQTENMLHALGLTVRGEFIVPHKRYNPKPVSYRNHFAVKTDKSWDDLVVKGLAKKAVSINVPYYTVTAQGIAYLRDILGYKFVYND